MRRATYTQGYARNKYQAAFPELWEGLVSYWDPSLGPTGLKLRDIVNGNDGTLTNMVAADAWPVTERGYALDYDGDNDFVDTGILDSQKPSGAMSIVCWARGVNNSTDIGTIGSTGAAGSRGFSLGVDDGDRALFSVAGGANSTTTAIASGLTITGNEYEYWVGVYSPSNFVRLYRNGELIAENVTAVPASQYTNNGITPKIGNRGDGTFFIGQIGLVSIYNIALPENRIRLMAAVATPAMLRDDVVVSAAVGIPIPSIMQQMDQYSGGAVL